MSNASELLKELRAMGVQLTLEGETLRLNAPKGAMTPEFQVRLRAAKQELVETLRDMQARTGPSSTGQIPVIPRGGLMPLSYSQQRLWFLHQMDPASPAYALLFLLRLKGTVNADAVEKSFKEIVQRHESLRTCFTQREGSPYTVIRDGTDWSLEKRNLRRDEGESLEAVASRFSDETIGDAFDIERGPLFRAYLLDVTEDEHILGLSMHHIISDGWSISLMLREFVENYRRLTAGEELQRSPLLIQYVDYAAWQRQWLDGEVLERQLRYWRKQLEGAPAVSIFPPDHPRPLEDSSVGGRRKRILSAELTSEIESFSRANDCTPFMTLMASFMLLLSRFSGQKDVVIGSPSANRTRSELSGLVGFFVNNLVLRAHVDDGVTFLDLLKRVREATLGAYENQDAPFDQVVRATQSERNPGYAPLFQTMLILHNFQIDEVVLDGLKVSPLEAEGRIARFDVTAEVFPYRNQLHVYFDYRSDLYEASTIDALMRSFEHVLQTVVHAPGMRVESVPLLSEPEKRDVLAFGNDTKAQLDEPVSLLSAFKRSVASAPEKIAIRAGNEALSYRELSKQANNLAARLKRAGAGPGDLVPVCVARHSGLVVALLAVLKTGAAYVPLDPIYPRQRIAGIVEDVQPKVIVTERALMSLVSEDETHCILIDEKGIGGFDLDDSNLTEVDAQAPSFEPKPEDVAYVIFTSGSTGKPKGVEIQHLALANFLDSMKRVPGFTESDHLLAVTTVSFDIAGLELFLPLYVGGSLTIAQAPHDLPQLLEDLESAQPTVMQATPALWQLLVSSGWEGSNSLTMLCGGEALTPQLARELIPRGRALWNMYGPTETTIWSSALRIDDAQGVSVPIGGPIQETTFYILDGHREPVPNGVAGELYIGGRGVARGYYRRAELTAERFVTAPFESGERLYRTGDLVRRLWDGRVEFIGRADFQVKIRGFRIELGEIEHALRQQAEISECVVLVREMAGQKELIAYLVSAPGAALPFDQLRERLRERLPEYMVPAGAVVLKEFPRLPNGKLDRSKLPTPTVLADVEKDQGVDETFNETEAIIAGVFRDLLQTRSIGRDQRFFDLGAHSLMLVRVHDRLRREVDPHLRLVSLFQFPSVASLARHIDKTRLSSVAAVQAKR